MPGTSRSVRRWFLAGVLGWLAFAVALALSAMPLGHDEAQYALATSSWLKGEPPPWNYLPIGMTALAAPGVLAGQAGLLRLVAVLCGLAFLVSLASLARRVGGASTAAWTVAVVAGSWCLVKRSADLLSDLPATACLLAAVTLVVTELSRERGPRWRLLAAAPWLAAAFYLRYGSCLPIAVLGGVALLGGWRSISQRPWPAVSTAALGVALLVPHFWVSVRLTGSTLGIIHESSAAVPSAFGSGLWTYVTANPFTYYGVLAAPLLVLGLGSIVRLRDRSSIMLWAIAVGDLVAVGLTTIGQSRYIFLGISILILLSVREVERWVGGRAERARGALVGAAGLVVVSAWASVAMWVTKIPGVRRAGARTTLTAAAAIARDAAGHPCLVVGRHVTQLAWYSGCEASHAGWEAELAHHRTYVVHEAGPYQPVLEHLPGRQLPLLDGPGAFTVLRLEPDGASR